MKNIIILKTLAIPMIVSGGWLTAEPKTVTAAEALSTAQEFFKSQCREVDVSSSDRPLKVSGDGSTPCLYVFNRCDSTGFVVVSGDDAAPAILGFGLSGPFIGGEIPDNLRAHLEHLCEDVSLARKSGDFVPLSFTGPQSGTGRRLITPDWNQSGFPYNALIPGNVHAGCVPAAMSIVMGAWGWPNTGEGTSDHSGALYADGKIVEYDIHLDHDVAMRLDKIPFTYSFTETSLEAKDALANLLYHTSVSVQSNYNESGSGASVHNAREALMAHFKYEASIPIIDYDQSITTIASSLREELAAGRPVIYSAKGDWSGHAFVCDGVWDDYFHFNFGWGGSGNGYYLLTAIKPYDNSYSYKPYILKNITPRITDSDYTPRTIEVVYDELPSTGDDPEITPSSDYSPMELSIENGVGGLASPFSSYPKGAQSTIYVSGLKLTGRYSGTEDEINELPPYDWVYFELAIGIVGADNTLRAICPTSRMVSVARSYALSGVRTLPFNPTVEVEPADRLWLYAREEGETEWKRVMGPESVVTELSGSSPSSDYVQFKTNVNPDDLSIGNGWGQLQGKIVKGQSYSFYIYPERPMESIDLLINGQPVPFTEVRASDGTVRYYYYNVPYITEQGIEMTATALSAEETELRLHLPQAGQLETMVGSGGHKIRHLTLTGEMDANDFNYLNSANFPMLNALDITDVWVKPYLSIFKADEIPQQFLYNYSGIEEIHLPKDIKKIGESSLYWCYRLKKVSIPADVEFARYALWGCPFEEVTNYSRVPQDIDEDMLSEIANPSVLYVPLGCKSAYESHPQWSKFTQIIEKDLVGVPSVNADDPSFSVVNRNGTLEVVGLDSPAQVKVYTLDGRMLWSGKSDTISEMPIPRRTALIVVVDGHPFKLY